MIFRVLRCLRAEITKLWRQRLPWVALFLAVLVTGLSAWMNAEVVDEIQGASAIPRNAFRFFSIGLRYGVSMGIFFLILIAGLNLSAESGQGTLKMVLVRPIHRLDLFLAKVGVVFLFALVLLLCVAGTAFLVSGSCTNSDFGPVVDPEYDDPENPYIYTEADEMWGHLFKALALLVLPVLTAGALGLLVSILFENPGVASGTAVVTFLGLETVKVFLEGRFAAWFLFNQYIPTFEDNSYVAILRGSSEGLSDAIWPAGHWFWSLWVPAATLIVLLVLSMAIFRRKAILS